MEKRIKIIEQEQMEMVKLIEILFEEIKKLKKQVNQRLTKVNKNICINTKV